jgi:Stigma-specific protein, Stig1
MGWMRGLVLGVLLASCDDTAVSDFPCDAELTCPGALRCDTISRLCIAGASCVGGTVECDGSCADLASDNSNCGSCNHACTSSENCVSGACQAAPPVEGSCFCLPGLECIAGTCSCGGRGSLCSEALCFDLQQSSLSCGTCLNFCSITGTECRAGTCTCPAGQKPCADACVDVTADPANCGACGSACGSGQRCERGQCVATCSVNLTNACGDGRCWDLNLDARHCGTTCRSCPSKQTCNAGVCTCPGATCSGLCTSLDADPKNCGACGNSCALGEACVAGSCTCQGGLTRCGSDCVSLTSQTDCGACGHGCEAGLSCANGQCVGTCPLGVEKCASGTCADTGNDPRNCGSCGQTCEADEVCVDGSCAQQTAAVGCTSCPCDTCTFEAQALCCTRGGAPFCVKSERCPR